MLNFKKGFTLIELLVVISVIGLLLGILLPVFARSKMNANKTKEMANLSSIHKGFLLYSGSNKDWFPGLDNRGKGYIVDFNGQYYGAIAQGTSSTAANGAIITGSNDTLALGINYSNAIGLEEGLISPTQLISLGETGFSSSTVVSEISSAVSDSDQSSKVSPDPYVARTANNTLGSVSDLNCSFAMLDYQRRTLQPEWKGNHNNKSIVLATRLIFTAGDAVVPDKFNSVWTENQSGKWDGSLVHGDSSASQLVFSSTILSEEFNHVKYGNINSHSALSSANACAIFGKSGVESNFDATNIKPSTTGKIGSPND